MISAVPEISAHAMQKAVNRACANHDLTGLKLIFPGSDRIALRLIGLVTDRVPSLVNDRPLADDIIHESRDVFVESLELWRREEICISRVLARYTWAAFNRASDIFCWEITISDDVVWDPEKHGILAQYHNDIVEIRLGRTLEREEKKQKVLLLLDNLLTDDEKTMMRYQQFMVAEAATMERADD